MLKDNPWKILPGVASGNKPVVLTGLSGGGLAFYLLTIARENPQLLVLLPEELLEETQDNAQALASLIEPATVSVFSSRDPLERLRTLSQLSTGEPIIVLASKESLESGATFSKKEFERLSLRLSLRSRHPHAELQKTLEEAGYERVAFVEDAGQYAMRGQIVDVFSGLDEHPLRMVFEGDEIESLRRFRVLDQKSVEFVDEARIYPAGEKKEAGLLDFWGQTPKIFAHAKQKDLNLRPDWVYDPLASVGTEDVGFVSVPAMPGGLSLFREHWARWDTEGFVTLVFSRNKGEQERLEELLHPEEPPSLAIGPLVRGFLHRGLKLAVVSNGEIFGRVRSRPRFPKFKGSALRRAQDLKKGDFVVHERYGIARYRGLQKLETLGQEADYLSLEYKGGDKLYVPLGDFKKVERYISAEGKAPRLYSLDSPAWARIKARASKAIEEMAKGLIRLEATRAARPGHPFPSDAHLEQEFADSFLYEETPDQTRAIAEVKADMQSGHPMDRLVLGDVGYGKTEVAMRAAFKAALDSKQVVLLAPTTILAEQHFHTFQERFADYPVRLGLLSRFQTKKEQIDLIRRLAKGELDIVIGTHRLLQKDVRFHDLGLVIIDEEHRFGVAQKERLKTWRNSVDVLSLSATPIPRTLSFALSGARALSVIETPPVGREPVVTQVGPWDPEPAKAAVLAELNRGGQVFYVYNLVKAMDSKKKALEEMLPGVKVGVAHGQLSGPALEEIMWKFLHKQYDVLLASTIIESGLDIPNVNTLIIENAEDFGLAQLYQLRGRVGRAKERAYCYLFYSTDGALSELAEKRIEAIREFSALGSGFQLALKDLEIRGAGNILGAEQHGFILELGFDLYSRLLKEEVERLKGRKAPEEEEAGPVVQLRLAANLPEDYLPTDAERIAFYKRLLSAREEELDDLKSELVDRCGPLPESAENLFGVMRVRRWARPFGLKEIIQDEKGYYFRFDPRNPLSQKGLEGLLQTHQNELEFLPGETFGFRLRWPPLSVPELLLRMRKFLSLF